MQNSPEYTLQLEKLHSRKSFGNASGAPKILTDFLAQHTVTSILDFGCGKGTPLDSLKSDKKVKISLFGTFSKKNKNSRVGRNPKTKEEKIISSRNVVSFKPSKFLIKKINRFA